MNTRKLNRRTNRNAFQFDSLESRQLMAADLTITGIQVTSPAVLESGEYTHAVITVKNIGDADVPAGTKLRPVFSRDGVYRNSDDLSLGIRTIDAAIKKGKSVTYEFVGRASAQPTGQWRFGVEVDPYNNVIENSGSNNVRLTDAPVVTYYDEMITTDIKGTDNNDVISFSTAGDVALVQINSQRWRGKKIAELTALSLDAKLGNDKISATADFPVKLQISGAAGNDTIIGGAAADELSGGSGKDRIFGGLGNDYIMGGPSHDRLYGEAGNDLINGAGGNDLCYGGEGVNRFVGGPGNDKFFSSGNGAADSVDGGSGDDTADADSIDVLTSI